MADLTEEENMGKSPSRFLVMRWKLDDAWTTLKCILTGKHDMVFHDGNKCDEEDGYFYWYCNTCGKYKDDEGICQ